VTSVTITDIKGNDFGVRSSDPGTIINYLSWYIEQNTGGKVVIDPDAGSVPLFPLPAPRPGELTHE